MEDGLGEYSDHVACLNGASVLILVVVEDGLGDGTPMLDENEEQSLNPCCSGRWSRRKP